MKIVSVRITPAEFPWTLPAVFVTTEDGVEQLLFVYFPDEISFAESELVGLTLEQGRRLKYEKDLRYLRS